MSKLFNSLGPQLFGAGRRAASSAERDASFFERGAERAAGAERRAVGPAVGAGHSPGGRAPIDLAPGAGGSGGVLGALGRSVAGGAGDLAMAALTSSGGSWALKTGAKLGIAYYLLMLARDYATKTMFGKEAMDVQAAAERGDRPASIPAGTGLPGGGSALPDGSALGAGSAVVRHASMTPQVAAASMNADRRYFVGMNAMDAVSAPAAPGSTVSAAAGPLAGGNSFFMLAEQGPAGGVQRSFTAVAGPEGSALSASRTQPLRNGVIERTAVEHGDGVAALAPMGPLDRTPRVTLGPDAPAAAGRLSSTLREPDAVGPMLGASSLGDVKAHSVQTGGTDRRMDVVFSGVGKDGNQVTGGMSFADGAAKVTLFGPDGKTPVWSKDLDGSGVSMSPTGSPVLSGKSAEQAGAFAASPSSFKESDDRARQAGLAPTSVTPGAGREHGPSLAGADGPAPTAVASADRAGPGSPGKIRFQDWDRHATHGDAPVLSAAAEPASPAPGLGGGSRFASANPAAASLDAGNPLARWAALGPSRDEPSALPSLGIGKGGPSLGDGPSLGR